ncbi:hypothetical protein D3C85_1769190 [compost metagenome]
MDVVYREWGYVVEENKVRKTQGSQKPMAQKLLSPLASLIEFMQKSPARKNLD